jgi:hypothetical protein
MGRTEAGMTEASLIEHFGQFIPIKPQVHAGIHLIDLMERAVFLVQVGDAEDPVWREQGMEFPQDA